MDFSAQNPATSNPLSLASRINDVNNVKRLLQTLNPNCVDNRGWTCLHEAAYYDSYESLMVILKTPQCRVRAETHEGHTALYLACKNNCSPKTIEALLVSEKNIANYASTEGVTPLHVASAQGNAPLIELLIKYGALLNVQDFDGDTPLHEAAFGGQYEALITLLYAGADPEIKNIRNFTPFHLACCKSYYPNIESLYPFVYDINDVTSAGDTALHYAVRGGAGIDIVDFLLDRGADPNILNNEENLPLDADISDVEVFKKLFSITDKENLKENIIIDACLPHKFKLEILETLLYSDLEPNYYNVLTPFNLFHYTTISPLNHYFTISAYLYGKSPEKFREFFYLFVMLGANVNCVNKLECPPLVYAQVVLRTGRQQLQCFNEVLEMLVQIGCDVDFCSAGKFAYQDINIPDAFATGLEICPTSTPMMIPYSLYIEPQDYLRFAAITDKMILLSIKIQHRLMKMVDKDTVNPEIFPFIVPPLKHICRYRIRKHFREMRNEDGSHKEFTTSTFLRAINALPLPTPIKYYLRYVSQ